MKRSIIILTIFWMSISIVNSQNSQVSWYSFNMGYGELKAGNTTAKSVIGQVFVGTTQQSNSQVISGFLADTLFRSVMVGVKDEPTMPTHFELYQNYPNPFNPSTIIRFDLPEETNVQITLYNILSEKVATLADETLKAGVHQVRFDASRFSSGVYFYRIETAKYIKVMKMQLIK